MTYYKQITDTCRKYFAATSDGVTKIKLDYDEHGALTGADYNPNIKDIPSNASESSFDEFIAARNEGEGFGEPVAFVGHEPIHK